MKALKVDFTPKRRLPAWTWALPSALFLALAVHQGWMGWTMHRQAAKAEAEATRLAAQLEQVLQARRGRADVVKPEPPYAKDAAAVASLAAFPLGTVLTSVESTRVEGVKVTALEISAAEKSVRADLEFTDQAALMRYLDQINAGEPKPRWTLIQAQATGPGGAGTAAIGSRWNDREQ